MTHGKQQFSLPFFAAISATCLVAAAANADTNPDQNSASANESIVEIVVSARKRNESAFEAPLTLSTFSAADLTNLGIISFDQAAKQSPGLSFAKAFGRTIERPVIRGMGNVLAGVQFGVESGSAYFLDGIYFAGDIQALNLQNLERIEVIKGPQSALYGRNTYAGAINFVTQEPSDSLEAQIDVSVAEHNEQRTSIAIAGPLIDQQLYAGVNLQSYERDGEWTNSVTGKNVGNEKSQSAGANIVWTPNDALTIKARVLHQEDDDNTRPLFLQAASDNNCFSGLRSLSSYPSSNSANQYQYYCGEIKPQKISLSDGDDADGIPNPSAGVPLSGATTFGNAYSLTDGTAFDGVERQLFLGSFQPHYIMESGHQLSASLSHRSEEQKTGSDSDHSSLNYKFSPPLNDQLEEGFFALSARSDIEDSSLEIRLQSPQGSANQWLLGSYYYQQSKNNYDITFTSKSGLIDSKERTHNRAFFGSFEAAITEQLSATLEARYSEETKKLTDIEVGTGTPNFDGEDTWYNYTPRLTLSYDLNENAHAYFIAAKGAKPGGFNGADGVSVDTPTYDQEVSENFELGYKTRLFDGRVRVNAAAYQTNITKIQLTTALPEPSGTVSSIATNQGEGRVRGLEFDVTADLNEHLRTGVSYALADSEFTQGCDDFQWTLTSGGGKFTGDATTSLNPTGLGDCSIVGKQFPLSSKHQASAYLTYQAPAFGDTEWFFNLDTSYESKKYAQVHNLAYAPSSIIWNARIGLQGNQWRLELFGRNLNDEDAIPMVTRWFQIPYFSFNTNNNLSAITGSDQGSPRAFLGGLRNGRQIGAKFSYQF